MDNLKTLLNSNATKLLLQNFPIVKKRTPFWFFTTKLKKNGARQYKRSEMTEFWHNMDPEAKREYFTEAEKDKVRFKEQNSMRFAEIGSILVKHGNNINEMLPVDYTYYKNEGHDSKSRELNEELFNKYQNMIQAGSTNKLYKDVIEKMDNLTLESNSLLNSVPENCRPVLVKPRRPSCAFAIFMNKDKDKIMKLKTEQKSTMSYIKFASLIWSNMTEDERSHYYKIYDQCLIEYREAMEDFNSFVGGNQSYEYTNDLVEASKKEKKAFRKALRRKLRESGVVPINVRNAFNFFVMQNKNTVGNLTKIWRDLPEEEKEKYRQMSRDDYLRYHKEKAAYIEFKKDLDKKLSKGDLTLKADAVVIEEWKEENCC